MFNEESIILQAYNNANEEEKSVLKNLFDEGIFIKHFASKPVWIQLWDKFCFENNLNIRLPHNQPTSAKEEWDNSCVMLRHIVEIKIHQWSQVQKLKTDWVPNWNDGNERKFYPRFNMNTLGGLFGFSYSDYGLWNANSVPGSRLCYPTAELCEETVKEFLPIYEKYMK